MFSCYQELGLGLRTCRSVGIYHLCLLILTVDSRHFAADSTRNSAIAEIRYDTVYLSCSKKLTGSQLSPPHGTNKKSKCETKYKTMSMIGPVQSRCHEGSPVGKRNLRWEGFVEKVGFEPGVKE